MSQTGSHARSGSIPRMPFQTPVLQQRAYKEAVLRTTPDELQAPSQAKQSKQPTLNVITGFDNPRTPPPPGYVVEKVTKVINHRRKESIQERRARAKAEESMGSRGEDERSVPFIDLSPSDRTVVIGFDNAVKTLNIETSIDHIISPVTPSIIVTGVPKDDGSASEDVFFRPGIEKHRSSVYSRATNAIRHIPQMAFRSGSAASTPPVPVLPRDLLDPQTSLSSRSGFTSWSTDFSEDDDGDCDDHDHDHDDDQSQTFVGSCPPMKDDAELALLLTPGTMTMKHSSQGWWNEITTPFLPRSATFSTKSRSPRHQPSPQPSPQPSTIGDMLTAENVASLDREVSVVEATTPHLADEKRATMGFFGEATPKTATFPSIPPLPESCNLESEKSPQFEAPEVLGASHEYYVASTHDEGNEEPFYFCHNHDCKHFLEPEVISDERQRELFNEEIAKENAANRRDAKATGATAGVAVGAATGLAMGMFASGHHGTEAIAQTPSLDGCIDPSDSISQVAERSARVEASSAIPVVPAVPAGAGIATPDTRQTVLSDHIGLPEVAEATAVPIMAARSPQPTALPERSVKETGPEAMKVPSVTHSNAEGETPGPASLPAPVSAPGTVSLVAPQSRSAALAPIAQLTAAREMLSHTREAEAPSHLPTPQLVLPPQSIAPYTEHEEIGVARSMPPPESSVAPVQKSDFKPAPSRNTFRRVPVPQNLEPSSSKDETVSPAAMTPRMAKDTEVESAVPMQSSRNMLPEQSGAAVSESGFTRRGVLERYDQRNSPPTNSRGASGIARSSNNENLAPSTIPGQATAEIGMVPAQTHRAAPSLPAQIYQTSNVHQLGLQNGDVSREVNEKDMWNDASQPKKPTKLSMIFAKLRERRNKNKKLRTKEEKKKRRKYCGIFCCLLMMALLIVILVMTLTIKRQDMPAQSSWLNLTGYPALPTGVATISRPNAVKEQSGCVQPATMWSCAVPKEQQNNIKPNAPDQPNFRFEIRFQNTTSNDTSVKAQRVKRKLEARDDFTNNLYTPSPAPPSDADQKFLGNTTDHNSAPFEGESTPFFISILPTNADQSNSKRKRDDESSSSDPSSTPSAASAQVSSASSTSSSASSSTPSSSVDPFPNVTAAIPSPVINSDGTAAAANLYPFPSAQPLRLYNRNQSTEHYGFYTYFDRSIFLTSASLSNNSYSYNTADVPGGAPETAASLRCTWAQTRFLVQIWTRMDPSTAQLLNGSATADAAAAGNITANSQNDWSQPGSFPYPVTVTLDRHGGDAHAKMLYCYDMDGARVNNTSAKLSLEDRGFDGTLINPVSQFFAAAEGGNSGGQDPAGSAGGIDGGTGGCGCVWQNWQQVGAGGSSGSSSGSSGSSGTSDNSAKGSGGSSTQSISRRRRFNFRLLK